MASKGSHGSIIAAAGGTAAATTSLGTITLPAGGPYKIFGVFGQIVRATATAAENISGSLSITAQSGDITPNILPNTFPLYESGSFLGALADQTVCPLQLFDVQWQAEGKAIIELFYQNEKSVTVAPQIIAGILFGDDVPTKKPSVHVSKTRAAITTAALQAVGTITLPETVTEITGVCGAMIQANVLTAGEELIGYWQMTSEDQDITPAQYPFANAYGAGLGATIGSAQGMENTFIPVSIPIIGGARLNVQVKLNTAVTNAAEVIVYVAHM